MNKISASLVRAELSSIRKRCFRQKERIALTKNNLRVAYLCPGQDKAILSKTPSLIKAAYNCHQFRNKLTEILEEMEAANLHIAEISYHGNVQFLMVSPAVFLLIEKHEHS